jgi:hypothetical protein
VLAAVLGLALAGLIVWSELGRSRRRSLSRG